MKIGMRLISVLTILLSLFFIGCTSYKPVQLPKILNETNLSLPNRPEKWWEGFCDKELNYLLNEAITKNFDLLAAKSRISQAKETLAKIDSSLYPSVDLSLSGSHSKESFENSTFVSNDISGSLQASYEVDLFGRLDALSKAGFHDYNRQKFDYETAYIALSSNLVTNWYDLAYSYESEKILKERIELARKEVALLKQRYQRQKAKLVDFLSQQSSLKQMESDLEAVKYQKELYKNTLSALLGKSPLEFNLNTIPSLPEKMPKQIRTVSSEVLLNRPDIQAALESLKAQDRRVAATVSAQYPRFSFNASVRQSDITLNNIFENWYSSITASILAPIYDAGSRETDVKIAIKKRKELLFHLKQLLVEAAVEVVNAIKSIETKQKSYLIAKQQLLIAEKKEASYRMHYLYGTEDFKRYLDAKLALKTAKEREVKSRLELIKAYISFYRATASGWE